MERDKKINKALEKAIRDIDRLYEKTRRFLTPEDEIKLAEKVKDLSDFLSDLIW